MSIAYSRPLFALIAALGLGLTGADARADGSAEHGGATHVEAGAPPEGTFLAADGLRSFRETYAAGTRPRRREPRYFRAVLEQFGILAIGTAYYWIRPEINKEDWDFPDYKTRMSNFTPTFDTNLHVTNNILHPTAGSFYYGFARLNGLSVPVALGYSITTSAMFEFFLEWLEKASVNDLIMTPMGGWAPGEFFVHLGEYFNSAPGGGKWTHKTSGWFLGLPHHLHKGEAFSAGSHEMPADSLGYSSYYSHRFATLLGTSRVTNEDDKLGQSYELRVEAEVTSIPGFLRPGRFSTWFSDGDFTEARMHAAVGRASGLSVDLFFDANVAGHYGQNIAIVDGVRKGRAAMFAIDTSMKFSDRRLANRYDGYAMANLVGPAFKLYAVQGKFLAKLEGATHPDFATMYSLAFPEWRAQFGDEGTKSALKDKGYYYAYGWSGRLRGTLSYNGLELGTRAFFGTYGSIDRWDRFQDKVTRDVHQTDQVTELEAWVGYTTPRFPLHTRLYAEHFGRQSNMEPVRLGQWDRRFGILVGAQF